ncbi:MAG: hypothetical protein ABF379_14240 [Akkermansiaceae bacterium]
MSTYPNITPFVGTSILAGLVITSYQQEAQSKTEKEPLTLQDFALDQEAEDAAATDNKI